MKQHRIMVSLVAVATVFLTFSGSARGLLTDLAGHWSGSLVAALEAKGLVSGDAFGRYEPEAPLTRSQFAKLLVVSLGNEADAKLLATVDSRFSDVPSWHWAKGYVESLAEAAVTTGYGDGRFAPNATVTRAEMATLLVRAAGLADQARLRGEERTTFVDDPALPAWARGAIVVAESTGLFNGFSDGTFRPNQPITRGEGAAVVLRMEEYRGTAYHLSGTLVRFNPTTAQGAVRDALGNERSIVMAPEAVYYHSGVAANATRMTVFDQVWVVLNAKGQGVFMEARYADLLGSTPQINGQNLQVTLPGGTVRTLKLQTGALFFLNGKQVQPAQAVGAQDAYVALDVVTGEARVVDTVKTQVQGVSVGVNAQDSKLFVNDGGRVLSYTVTPGAIVLVNGQRSEIRQIQTGDRIRLALDDQGAATYVQVER